MMSAICFTLLIIATMVDVMKARSIWEYGNTLPDDSYRWQDQAPYMGERWTPGERLRPGGSTYKRVLSKIREVQLKVEAKKFIRKLDEDGDERLTKREFMRYFPTSFRNYVHDEDLIKFFDYLDANHDKDLDEHEIESIMDTLRKPLSDIY